MKKCLLLLTLMLTTLFTHAQNISGPMPVTPIVVKKINAEIEKQLQAFMVKYEKNNEQLTDKFDEGIKFAIDTFKIESFFHKYIDIDYSTAGMNQATYDAAAKYDSLMNKYYKLLSAKLQPADKSTLLAAQRSWLAFRDKELKLSNLLTQDKYSGGGSIQSLVNSSQYLYLIKQRAVTIFEYYSNLYN